MISPSDIEIEVAQALKRIAVALTILAIVAVVWLTSVLVPLALTLALAALEPDPLDCITDETCPPLDELIPNARRIES